MRRALWFSAAALVATGSAWAQTAGTSTAATTPTDSNGQPVQEVVVTGSLIARPNAETAEAVTILKADDLKSQGVENVEQALASLAANNTFTNIASSVGTFSGGGTYANLRNLGEGRTLILLDGQRLANNAFTGHAVDLSGIPFSAIDSIEVLREGASAEYGSDAIAGVINFKTKKNWQGAEIQGNIDRPQHSGGTSNEIEFSLGHGDLENDGYNVMLTGSYTKQNELKATQRDFSAYGFYPAGGYTSTNYPGNWPGNFRDANKNYWQVGYPTCAGNPYLTTYFGDCEYRYSAATDLLPDSFAVSGLASLTKSLPGNNQIQLQYFYTQSQVTDWSGPMFYYFTMDPSSPYYPTASELTCISTCGTATTPDLASGHAVWTDPGNNRYNGNVNAEQRVVLTFSGKNGPWNYSTDFNFSQNTNDNRNVSGYPNEDILAPGGVLSDLINPYGAQTAEGQALINGSYVSGVYAVGKDQRWSFDGDAGYEIGDLFKAGEPVSVAAGFDIGGERFVYGTTPYNDLVSAATGLSDSSVSGSRQSQAAYVELVIPVIKDLEFDVSDREDRYSDFGNTNNWKAKVRYQPFSILTLRATASTGFRAPTLYDLYSLPFLAASTSGTMGSGNPDCTAGNYIAPFTASTCSTQGLGLFGGNAKLTPEKSQNYDFGVVISPIDDLGITLDYYRVLLTNTIGTVPATAIYGDPSGLASYIKLDSSGGLTPSIQEASSCTPYTSATCGYLLLSYQNTGKISTDGIDASIQYQQHTPIGSFHEDLEGTLTTQFREQQYQGGPVLNLVGWYNTLPPAYRWVHNLKLDWTSPKGTWGAGLSERFYSSYIDEFPDGNGNQRIVGSYSLVDGYASFKPIDQLTVLFGIKNLFDTSPPFTNAYQDNFAAGYNALVADPLLRNFYVNMKYTFL